MQTDNVDAAKSDCMLVSCIVVSLVEADHHRPYL
jgi:hypothetical protein